MTEDNITTQSQGDRRKRLPYVLGLAGAGLILLGTFAFPFSSGEFESTLITLYSDDLGLLFLEFLLPAVVVIAVSIAGLTIPRRIQWCAGALFGAGITTVGRYILFVMQPNFGVGLWLYIVGSVTAAVGGIVAVLQSRDAAPCE